MIYHSIFNEVLGPITTGPSSSHTAGCGRIGLVARSLYGKDVCRADVVFDKNGSYPSTYQGQGSDYGFTGGLLGIPIDDPRFRDSLRLAKAQGVDICFKTEDLGSEHPNQAEIRFYESKDAQRPSMRLMTYSIGGGMIEIRAMDDFPVYIDGSSKEAFILCSEACEDAVEEVIRKNRFFYDRTDGKGERFFEVDIEADQDSSPLLELRNWEGVQYVRIADPVMAVPKRRASLMPFGTAAQALEYGEAHGLNAAQLACVYESAYGFVSEEGAYALAARTEEVMRAASVPPDPETTAVNGFLPYFGKQMAENAPSSALFGGETFRSAMLASVAVMENNNAHNVVAAAPTAGASGVLPGAIVAMGSAMGFSSYAIREGLLAAGLVGAFIGNQATFGAEVAGCQAENGAASAMAAAGIAHMLGCPLKAVFGAAGLALQNMLGLVCDPVAGLTELPCISRNVSAMANAVMCANMAKLGFDGMIPLDEVIGAMLDVGHQLPAELRCTCKGGICTTKTGQRLQTWMNGMRADKV